MVPFELFIDSRIPEGLTFAGRFLVTGQEVLIVVDPDELALHFEHDFFPNHMVGDLIAIAVIRKLTILVHLPEKFEGGVIIPRRDFYQAGYLLCPA